MTNRIILIIVTGVLILSITCIAFTQENKTISEKQILASYLEKEGFLPKPLVLMAEQAGVLSGFMSYGKKILEGGPLGEKERYLVSLAAAVALKSPDCIRAHITKVSRAGASHEEIIQAILIAGPIGNTSALQIAADVVNENTQ